MSWHLLQIKFIEKSQIPLQKLLRENDKDFFHRHHLCYEICHVFLNHWEYYEHNETWNTTKFYSTVLILKYQNHATFYLTLPQQPVPGLVITQKSFLQESNSLMTSNYALTLSPLAPLHKLFTPPRPPVQWPHPPPNHHHTLHSLLSLLPSLPPKSSISSFFIQAAEHSWRK